VLRRNLDQLGYSGALKAKEFEQYILLKDAPNFHGEIASNIRLHWCLTNKYSSHLDF